MNSRLITFFAAASLAAVAGCANNRDDRRADSYAPPATTEPAPRDEGTAAQPQQPAAEPLPAAPMPQEDVDTGAQNPQPEDNGFVNPYADQPQTLPPSEDSDATGGGTVAPGIETPTITGPTGAQPGGNEDVGPNSTLDRQDSLTLPEEDTTTEEEDAPVGDEARDPGDTSLGTEDRDGGATPTPPGDLGTEDAPTGDENRWDMDDDDTMPGQSPNQNNTAPRDDEDAPLDEALPLPPGGVMP